MISSRPVRIVFIVIAAIAYLVAVALAVRAAANIASPDASGALLALIYLGAIFVPALVIGGGVGWFIREKAFTWGLAVGVPTAVDILYSAYHAYDSGLHDLPWIKYGVNALAVLLLPAIMARVTSLLRRGRTGSRA